MPTRPIRITAYTLTNALGSGVDASLHALQSGQSGLRPCDLQDVDLSTWIGRVDGIEAQPLPTALSRFECRNNRLAHLALQADDFSEQISAAVHRYGADRIGLFMGTSTSGISATEEAYRHRNEHGDLPDEFQPTTTHIIYSITGFVRSCLQLKGVALTVSTACSSSAKVFATAQRYLEAGLCDAAVVGGVDSLCLTTLYGFHALDLVSSERCKPWDVNRDGINIGEGAGFALLEREQAGGQGCLLLGSGESSDAYHMSTPHPEGRGAALAMRLALSQAGVAADEVGYINLHGTATPSNDAAEDAAVMQVFGRETPCSSTKGWTGHTLGAAGAIEVIVTLMALEAGYLPCSLNTEQPDNRLSANVLLESVQQEITFAMSNSFGFGGNNCSLLFGCER
ncbi:MAG: beta-ketoacyl-[acyl-carrier-protein] synthase family protein [Candidatus Polarisedimenticolaceae bacterium]|nr:beta-ketoacyl-[acyl-carrier-protein] synthase family protein [Candidatus Polarisedimenticolaceae bacterium]